MKRLALLLLLSGCAAVPRVAPPLAGEVRSIDAARDVVETGRSTKAEVRARLGRATEIDFDSGWSVWVYKQQLLEGQPGPRRELVLLFPPAGPLEKARTR